MIKSRADIWLNVLVEIDKMCENDGAIVKSAGRAEIAFNIVSVLIRDNQQMEERIQKLEEQISKL